MDRIIFKKQLKYWSLHTTLCASPSFILALGVGFNTPKAILAMLLGVASLVVLYASLSSLPAFSSHEEGLLSRAKRYGLRTRLVICFLELLGTLAGPPLASVIVIDFFAGWAALMIVGLGTSLDGVRLDPEFFPIYFATIIEGLIVSGILFGLFCAILWMIRFCRGSLESWK